MIKRIAHLTYKAARRIVVAIVGATVLLIGLVMLVTPGPGLVVIPIGLAILGLEFAWARYWLSQARDRISRRNSKVQGENIEAHRDRVRRGPG